MSSLLPLLATVCIFAASVVCPAEDRGNLIPNPGFEDIAEGSDPSILPRGMQATSDEKEHEVAFFSLAEDQKASGKRSLCIRRTDKKGNARVTIATIPVQPGGRYYLSCEVKSTDGRPCLLLDLQDKNGKGVTEPLIDAVNLSPGGTLAHGGRMISLPWATSEHPDRFNKLEAVFTIPPDIHFLVLRTNYSWITGTAWYDDFALYSLD